MGDAPPPMSAGDEGVGAAEADGVVLTQAPELLGNHVSANFFLGTTNSVMTHGAAMSQLPWHGKLMVAGLRQVENVMCTLEECPFLCLQLRAQVDIVPLVSQQSSQVAGSELHSPAKTSAAQQGLLMPEGSLTMNPSGLGSLFRGLGVRFVEFTTQYFFRLKLMTPITRASELVFGETLEVSLGLVWVMLCLTESCICTAY